MENVSYKCPRCGNTDPNSIGYLKGVPYCRLCLPFTGKSVNRMVTELKKDRGYKYYINYEISEEQEEISNKVLDNFTHGINTLIDAVCGAGKTEIVLKVISYALKNNMTVGFAIPRRDVVIEIYNRLSEIFKDNDVIAVYGGHNDILEGDIIVLTTHQLYRYEKYFDLLIFDEIDAFPYKGSTLLEYFFKQSVSKNYVLMSATASDELKAEYSKDGYEVLSLNKRFHGHKLPVPIIWVRHNSTCLYTIVKKVKEFERDHKPVFIFCPTISLCEELYDKLRFFFKDGECVHSQKEDREQIISDFKNGKYWYLVTTQVLERGVTVEDLQIIVAYADHEIYDTETLIQISGRVGRKANAPDGEVIFIGEEKSKCMLDCVKRIEEKNTWV
ncbi:MAG: DEAD/DEAH box helicase [Coprobacillus sp.]|nr:DEAD/DEAH box helicase [Coprobacillus sp.]